MNSLQENDDENDSQSGLHFSQQLQTVEEGRGGGGQLMLTDSPEKANETLEVEPTTLLSTDPPLASSSLGSVKDSHNNNNNNNPTPLVQRMSFRLDYFLLFSIITESNPKATRVVLMDHRECYRRRF
jgi:hypothetical protein